MNEPVGLTDTIQELLKNAGLRCTRGRIVLLRILIQSTDPLSHEELHRRMKKTGINRVTVYRILQSLVEKKIVHRLDGGDRVWRFAVCGRMHRGHCHPHFICRSCGRIECLSECPMPTVPKAVSPYRIEEQEVYFRGLCSRCVE